METNRRTLHFFMGANTPQGFVSRFDQLGDASEGWRKFVIKGGPGTGKSSMMKRLAAELEPYCDEIELVSCSSDIHSLDAVVVPSIKASIADGTAPHVIEPKYPGAFESVVNLCDCWDGDALQRDRAEIIEAYTQTARCHERCCRFLAAAGSLLSDTYRIAAEYTDPVKIARYAGRLARREFHGQSERRGKESVRFLSAVTAQGVTVFEDTPEALCPHIWLIEDEYGAVSRLLMNALRANALAAGLDIISCYCVTAPYEKLEHLLIPSIGVAFLTANRYHPFTKLETARRIHAKRFMDTEELRAKRQRLSFNRRAVSELLGEASSLLAEAKERHDELEQYYVRNVDFERINAKSEEVISEFLGLCMGGGQQTAGKI